MATAGILFQRRVSHWKNNTCCSCAVPRSREVKENSISSSSFTTNTETDRNSQHASVNRKSHQVVSSDFRNNSLLSKTKEDVTSDFLLISFCSASLFYYFTKNESFAAQQHVPLSRINTDLNTLWHYCKMKDLLKCHSRQFTIGHPKSAVCEVDGLVTVLFMMLHVCRHQASDLSWNWSLKEADSLSSQRLASLWKTFN